MIFLTLTYLLTVNISTIKLEHTMIDLTENELMEYINIITDKNRRIEISKHNKEMKERLQEIFDMLVKITHQLKEK